MNAGFFDYSIILRSVELHTCYSCIISEYCYCSKRSYHALAKLRAISSNFTWGHIMQAFVKKSSPFPSPLCCRKGEVHVDLICFVEIDNPAKWASGCKNRRHYSRERDSERLKNQYDFQSPYGNPPRPWISLQMYVDFWKLFCHHHTPFRQNLRILWNLIRFLLGSHVRLVFIGSHSLEHSQFRECDGRALLPALTSRLKSRRKFKWKIVRKTNCA